MTNTLYPDVSATEETIWRWGREEDEDQEGMSVDRLPGVPHASIADNEDVLAAWLSGIVGR